MIRRNKETKKKRILDCLKRRSTPITARRLADCADVDWYDASGTRPYTRKLIRELISEGNPIGSNNKGYFLLRSDRETQRYLNALLQRQAALSQRIADVFYGKMGGGK
ncbi:MAG: hypothetical protein ACYS32_00500 [Planctomycetota bacterium]|jgi:hypothetical protein